MRSNVFFVVGMNTGTGTGTGMSRGTGNGAWYIGIGMGTLMGTGTGTIVCESGISSRSICVDASFTIGEHSVARVWQIGRHETILFRNDLVVVDVVAVVTCVTGWAGVEVETVVGLEAAVPFVFAMIGVGFFNGCWVTVEAVLFRTAGVEVEASVDVDVLVEAAFCSSAWTRFDKLGFVDFLAVEFSFGGWIGAGEVEVDDADCWIVASGWLAWQKIRKNKFK
jgi:hypothetical protein